MVDKINDYCHEDQNDDLVVNAIDYLLESFYLGETEGVIDALKYISRTVNEPDNRAESRFQTINYPLVYRLEGLIMGHVSSLKIPIGKNSLPLLNLGYINESNLGEIQVSLSFNPDNITLEHWNELNTQSLLNCDYQV